MFTMMMNLMTSSHILLFLFGISGSTAQEFPTSVVTRTSPTTSKPTNFEGGSPPETLWTTSEECGNAPGWSLHYEQYYNCSWNISQLSCDDDRVNCGDRGNLGFAADHCCKCKYQCGGQCNDPIYFDQLSSSIEYIANIFNCNHGGSEENNYDDYDDDTDSNTPWIMAILLVIGFTVMMSVVYTFEGQSPAQVEVQQTMTARRQQQRENNTLSQGLTEEERNHARFEQFLTSFCFQTVLPNKSNIAADTLRNLASNQPDEEHASAANDHDVDDESIVGRKQGASSYRLSSRRMPSAKDECCICLESYAVGETICAPINQECNHVFHEGCINEWLKKNIKCPLCRVELLKE